MLTRVVYELFDWEAEWLTAHPGEEAVELRRQLRLESADAPPVYIAWTWGPAGDDYHVGFAPTSFCTDAPEFEREASASPLWIPLIGRGVELSYRDADRQVLEIRSGAVAVLCCSFAGGVWGVDVLRVCRHLPEPETARIRQRV